MALREAVGAMLFMTLAGSQEPTTLQVTATYRERMTLPPNAVLEATLEDVSQGDAPTRVLGGVRMEKPGQPPFLVMIEYDASRIVASHTYVVRARIIAGDRLLFTEDRQYPVLTMGNSAEAKITLRRAGPPVKSGAPAPLGALPATFSGKLPCADCPGILYVLDLFPDQSFYLNMTYLGRNENIYDIGRWSLSSDGTTLTLHGQKDSPEPFAVKSDQILQKLGGQEGGALSQLNFELARTPVFERLEPRLPMRGMFQYMADAATFRECRSGQRWPVAMERGYKELEAAYVKTRRQPGDELLASLEGQVAMRPGMEGGQQVPTLVVEAFTGVWPGETCGAPLATSPLQETYWKLTRLEGNSVTVGEKQREPHLVFRKAQNRVTGFGGCNTLSGSYTVNGDALTFGAIASTQMACPQGMDTEAAFFKALGNVRSWKITGEHLELYDASGNVVARFEARAMR